MKELFYCEIPSCVGADKSSIVTHFGAFLVIYAIKLKYDAFSAPYEGVGSYIKKLKVLQPQVEQVYYSL